MRARCRILQKSSQYMCRALHHINAWSGGKMQSQQVSTFWKISNSLEFPRNFQYKWDDEEARDLISIYTSGNNCMPNANYLWMIEESLYMAAYSWYSIQSLLLLTGLKAFPGLWLHATSSPTTWHLWWNLPPFILSQMKEQHRVQCAIVACW